MSVTFFLDFHQKFKQKIDRALMFFSFLQLAVGSRDLSQAEKEITLCKAEQIHKMTTILTQNDKFLHPGPF